MKHKITEKRKPKEYPPIVVKILAAIGKEIERQTAQGKIAEHNVEVLRDARLSVELAARGGEFRLSEILPVMQELTAHFALLTEELTRGTAGLPSKKTGLPAAAQPKSKLPGMLPFVVNILHSSFAVAGDPPHSLEDALVATYGANWADQKIPNLLGPGNIEMRRLADDVASADSVVKAQLLKGIEVLALAKKHPRSVSPRVLKLYQQISGVRSPDDVVMIRTFWFK